MLDDALRRLGMVETHSGVCSKEWVARPTGAEVVVINPATGQPIARVHGASAEDYDRLADEAASAFLRWRATPAPRRGDIVRRIGDELRRHKQDLGRLVSLESGKILSEGLGEVQEMIDMCDFAVGLSRQLYGLTIASERREHRMLEQWHPLGPIGIITAFNFPVAVWAWNAMLALVCGNSCLWKPSHKTPLSAIAVQGICQRVLAEHDLTGLLCLCVGSTEEVGERMVADRRLPLISATGSCAMGRRIAPIVSGRLGRVLLELGGNNGAIVSPTADLDLTLRAIVFAAVGTAGQRCTTLRRLFVHERIADSFVSRLVAAYKSVRIGDPTDETTLMGPLIDQDAVDRMLSALQQAKEQGGEILCGGKRFERPGFFVEPTIVQATPDMPIVSEETFAPILYVMTYSSLEDAIGWHNSVDQGLSSSIFTDSVLEMERFLSATGSDCGIANVNIGTSGAEIGGAFGGEKDTGGGREAGSDAWKAYMRRQTCTINGGRELPLAQGVRFEVEG